MHTQRTGDLSPDNPGPTPSFAVWGCCEDRCREHIYARAKDTAGNCAIVPERNGLFGNVACRTMDATNEKEDIESSVWAWLGGKAYPRHTISPAVRQDCCG